MEHRCRRCGGSCTGVGVRPVDDAERARIESHARTLGIERPLVGGALRLNMGRCVFLAEGACRLHAALGPQAKPRVCRQFPVVAVRIGDARRLGIDPGCLHGLDGGGVGRVDGLLAAEAAADAEGEALVAAASLAGLAGRLGWTVADHGAWRARQPLAALADAADVGPLLREAAAALRDAPGLEDWPSPPHESALVDGIRRMVHLRLLPDRGRAAVADLLGGVLLAAAAQPDDPRWLASAWFRLVRVL